MYQLAAAEEAKRSEGSVRRVQREDFEHFVRDSGMSAQDLFERAKNNCHLKAQEALDLRLIARILG